MALSIHPTVRKKRGRSLPRQDGSLCRSPGPSADRRVPVPTALLFWRPGLAVFGGSLTDSDGKDASTNTQLVRFLPPPRSGDATRLYRESRASIKIPLWAKDGMLSSCFLAESSCLFPGRRFSDVAGAVDGCVDARCQV